MAYDPRREDYLRLSLRFAHTLDGEAPDVAARAFAGFGRRFARSRDSLPQTDADRAFRLVADAAELIDYKLPFAASDEDARRLIDRGHQLLDEAVALDPDSADAHRMLASAERPGFDGFHDFLAAGADEVIARCTEARDAIADDTERAALERDIAMRPALRWLATMAANAVVCGRNRKALRICARALELDPSDGPDVRYTAALAFAKLEDEQGLQRLLDDTRALPRSRDGADAWTILARCALAHKRRDLDEARTQIGLLITAYPHAAATLVRQRELPDGVFARFPAPPYSEDELIVALSEGTVLLLEGREQDGRGPFGLWVAETAAEMAPKWEAGEVAEAQQQVADSIAQRDAWERNRGQGGPDGPVPGSPSSPDGPVPDGPSYPGGPVPDGPSYPGGPVPDGPSYPDSPSTPDDSPAPDGPSVPDGPGNRGGDAS